MFNYMYGVFFNIFNFCAKTAEVPVVPEASVPVSTPMPIEVPIAQATSAMSTLQYVILFVYFAVCAALVFLVLVQTSKSEGLMGTLGGSTQSVFKGKKSVEEQMTKITAYIAVGFIVLSVLIGLFVFKR
ncbi:MAG: preprotein translocase subunit SecG [Armatimonadota bacterium]